MILVLCAASGAPADVRKQVKQWNDTVERGLALLAQQRYAPAAEALEEAWRMRQEPRLSCKLGKAYLGLRRAMEARRLLLGCREWLERNEPSTLTDEVRADLESDLATAQQLLKFDPTIKDTEPEPAPVRPPERSEVSAAPPIEKAPVATISTTPPAPIAAAPQSIDLSGAHRARRRTGWIVGFSLTTMLGIAAATLGGIAYQKARALPEAGALAYADYVEQSRGVRNLSLAADVGIGAALLAGALTIAIVPNLPRPRSSQLAKRD